jgi:hypothetical protein
MPLIVGATMITDPNPLLNGFLVSRGRRSSITVLYGDVPASVRSQSIANQEAWISTFLTNQLDGAFVGVHIFSLNPMSWIYRVSNTALPATWWQAPTMPGQ